MIEVQIRPLRDWNVIEFAKPPESIEVQIRPLRDWNKLEPARRQRVRRVQIRPLRDWNEYYYIILHLNRLRSNQTVAGLKRRWRVHEHSHKDRFKSDRCGIETPERTWRGSFHHSRSNQTVAGLKHNSKRGKDHDRESSNQTVAGLKQCSLTIQTPPLTVQIRPLRDWNVLIAIWFECWRIVQIRPLRDWNKYRCFRKPFNTSVQIRPLRDWNAYGDDNNPRKLWSSNQTVAGLKQEGISPGRSAIKRSNQTVAGLKLLSREWYRSLRIRVQIRPLRDWNGVYRS